MTAPDWQRVKQIFHEALEVSPAEREQRVNALCGGDEALRSRVDALLTAHAEADELPDSPTVEGANAAAAAASGLAATAPPEGPGARIGPYKLLQQIGEGGFGTVYMAEQEQPIRRRVALKIIKPGMDTKQVIARFEAERQALAMMDHPNIAKVFDAGATETGRPYFVMELVRGIPITEYCDENRLSTRERLELFAVVCSALQHAHQNGIIHRDIKPSNVMITLHDGTPVPKVIDFGVAKAIHQRLTEKTLFTEYNQFIGTPVYMSPEQAALGGLEIDTRSDVYSLGVLLYELLTGTTPFDSGTLRRAAYIEVLRILKEDDPPRPSTRVSTPGDRSKEVATRRQVDPDGLARTLRGDLDWIVMKALEKNRARRYGSAADMAADIRRYFEQEPIEARPPSLAYRTGKLVRKRARPLAVAAVIVLLLGFEGVRSVWLSGDTALASDAGTIGPRLLLNDEDDYCFFGPEPSPDGSRIAYADICQDGDVFVKDLASGETSRLTTEGYYFGVAWSPDGRQIATARVDAPQNQTLLLDAATGAANVPPALEGMNFDPSLWSPDGSLLAGSLRHPDLNVSNVVVSLVTGEVTRIVENEGQWQGGISGFSPDGRYLAYAETRDGNQDVYVIDLETLERQRVTTGPEPDGGALWSPDGRTIVFENPAGAWGLDWQGGRATGEARLVRSDPLAGSFWRGSGFYHEVDNSTTGLLMIPVDPATGRATGDPQALPDRLDNLPSMWMRWAPDMERMAFAGWGQDGVIRVARGDVVSEFPVGSEFLPSNLWWASDGSELLYTTASRARRDRTTATVYALDPVDGTVRELFPRIEGINHIHVSPDGASMLFFRPTGEPGRPEYAAGELVIADLGSADGQVLARSSPDLDTDRLHNHFGQPAFSPDGSRILYLRHRGADERSVGTSLWVMNRDGSDARQLAASAIISWTNWHPSGRFIAYQTYENQDPRPHLWVVSVEDGSIHEIDAFSRASRPEFKGWSPDGRWLTFSETVGRREYWVVPDLLETAAR